ncbi:MAG: undecaprenyldiphospho-muramoylpentapeptide beta-N-acetylglucosaminyltransferase [Patescibacteria group bacterium]|nr:undecaprenyldiphospho-muramoylpentapeptide beta-N-acetylglucosaminyltransferase [Patescibacteria group bacterium]
MEEKHFKIIFVGGGTAGHVAPNLAIIDELVKISKAKNVSVDFLYIGRRHGIEQELIGTYGLRYKGIFTGKLRRYFDIKNFSDIFLMLIGFVQSFFILLFNRPDIIFAKGGFVTVPFCLAAALLRIPFVIHESDSVIGLSNKILLPFAKKVYLGFPVDIYKGISIKKTYFSGNPVRKELLNIKSDKKNFFQQYGLDKTKKIIFVLGGSQGSGRINELIDELLNKILANYNLIHQTGKNNEEYFRDKRSLLSKPERERYLEFGYAKEELKDFLNNTDLVVSRAGANSIAEIVALKKPAILIPLSSAAADHQNKNAKFLQKNEIASVLDENLLTAEKLYEEIDFLMKDKKTRDSMVKNMKNIFPENSAHIIAEEILGMVAGSK